MINESYEWKQAIKRNNAYVRRFGKTALADVEGSLLDRIQMRIVSNALFVRRLLETPKVATALKSCDLAVVAYPCKSKDVDYFNNHRLDAKYQLKSGVSKSLRGSVLCDQVIHSFVWAWMTNESDCDLYGFLVASDRKKHSELYVVQLDHWFEFTHAIASSYPSRMSAERNQETGQWEFVSE